MEEIPADTIMDAQNKKVSLIIPALNEEGCIGKTLQEIPHGSVDEIVVVDGHSTDTTVSEAKEALGERGKVILQNRKGFGGALFDGIDASSGDIIMVMDADGSQNPNDIPKILAQLDYNTLVLASRYAEGGKSDDDTPIRRIGNWFFTKLTNLVHGTRVTDSLYLFFAMAREDFKKLNLQSLGYGICIEFLVKAKRAGLIFKEIPAIERARYAGQSKVNAFWDGWKILRVVLRKY